MGPVVGGPWDRFGGLAGRFGADLACIFKALGLAGAAHWPRAWGPGRGRTRLGFGWGLVGVRLGSAWDWAGFGGLWHGDCF
jgi:hypothetical protein